MTAALPSRAEASRARAPDLHSHAPNSSRSRRSSPAATLAPTTAPPCSCPPCARAPPGHDTHLNLTAPSMLALLRSHQPPARAPISARGTNTVLVPTWALCTRPALVPLQLPRANLYVPMRIPPPFKLVQCHARTSGCMLCLCPPSTDTPCLHAPTQHPCSRTVYTFTMNIHVCTYIHILT